MKNTSFWHKHSSFNPFVVSVTLISVLVLVACTLFVANGTQHILNTAKSLVFQNFSWFYIFSVSLFLIFLLFVALGGLGKIKLGSDEEKPEFSFMSWMAMLFAAGMGVGLMFFGVAEPLLHFNSSIVSGSLHERSQQAILHTAFHLSLIHI
ncbi:BCCT family transporter, partial [Kingella kingae]|uniref:BCCT family transporter n=1 Tax=Kingella kingae TaxID=504 RepID=UPI00254B66F3